MTRLEDTYKSQLGTSTAVIEELEIRVGETMKQENANSEAYSRLAQEKVSLEGTLESIRHEILIKNDRLHQLEEENAALEREKRDALECQQRRHEEAVVQLRKQMKQQENQWSKRMKEAEKKLSTCSESKEERERMYKKELTELEILSKRKLQEERRKYVQKVHTYVIVISHLRMSVCCSGNTVVCSLTKTEYNYRIWYPGNHSLLTVSVCSLL
jgi:DNA repair exonuclease SbcCD ATPase subunit